MTLAPDTHVLSDADQTRLDRLTTIAQRIDTLTSETTGLYRERDTLIGDLRVNLPRTPVGLLAEFAAVSPEAVQAVIRAEETRRGLERYSLGRRKIVAPPKTKAKRR